jgi:hypothetical protein
LALLALGYLALAGSLWNEKARRRRELEDDLAARKRTVAELERSERRPHRGH